MSLKLKAGVFYGDAARTATAPGFRFTESSYQPGMNLPPHSHELAHFCLVLQGSYVERLGSVCEERKPSNLIYYPPDTVHAESSHSGGRHLLIEIETWRTEAHDRNRFARGPMVLANQAPRWIANRLLREFRDGDELAALAMESLALELMVDLGRNDYSSRGQKSPRWLTRVKDALDHSFQNPPTLEVLGLMVDVHPVHLSRAFHRFQRCTISEYIRQVRVNHARYKMARSNDSLADIALAYGFSDQSHFSRSFKRITGLTPVQFRKLTSRR